MSGSINPNNSPWLRGNCEGGELPFLSFYSLLFEMFTISAFYFVINRKRKKVSVHEPGA